MAAFDLLIKGAKIFDGLGGEPVIGDLALKNGRISARGRDLPDDIADKVVDASGLWLMPGLIDAHTHYDLEVELDPALPESVRHGATTVIVSNCSLGLAFGALRKGREDPVVDCFARVENIPKPVLSRVADKATWNDSREYLLHLDEMRLGPNIAPMIPYSMLRIAVMGTDASVSRPASEAEIREMERLLEKGMAEGYIGFSSDALPFHYLSNDPNRDKRIPSQYGSYDELKRLTAVVRRYGRLWQATPASESPLQTLRMFLLSSGRFFKKPLKITAVAALDLRSNRMVINSAYLLTRILNSRLLGGRFTLQSLAAPFKVFSDGPVSPLSEEIPELRELMKVDLEDRAGRQKLYDDLAFEARFKAMWRKGKSGFNLARVKRFLRLDDWALRRAADEMFVERAPVASWKGQSFAEIMGRLKRFQETGGGARDAGERAAFAAFPPVEDDADFVFHLFKIHDRDICWWTVSANANEKKLRKIIMDPEFLPGFADSGAHLTNIAFYDVNLRALKIAMEEKGEEGVAYMVKRLTRDAAQLFNIEAGSLEPGAEADVILIDPRALAAYDSEAATQRIHREVLDNDQLVNRSDGVVSHVFIRGQLVWNGREFTKAFEKKKLGRLLRARGAGPL
jgi:N-acyl-D-aspartate/D-glutamate deacylase